MACDLLSFQGLQAERRDSIPLRSTIKTAVSLMDGAVFILQVLGGESPCGFGFQYVILVQKHTCLVFQGTVI